MTVGSKKSIARAGRQGSASARAASRRRASYARGGLNGVAGLAMIIAALMVPGWMTIFFPHALTWIPATAFCAAALAPWKPGPSWVSLLGLMLNLASVLLFCAFALVAATHRDVMLLGLPLAAAGAALSGWNVFHLSREGW